MVSQDTLRENGFILILGVLIFIFSVINGAPIFSVLAGLGILFFWFACAYCSDYFQDNADPMEDPFEKEDRLITIILDHAEHF